MVLLNHPRHIAGQFPQCHPAQTDVTNRDDLTTCYFAVQGETDPGLIPRIVEFVAKRGLVPTRLHAVQCTAPDQTATLHIDMQVDGVSPMTGVVMAEAMRQTPGVIDVGFSTDDQQIFRKRKREKRRI